MADIETNATQEAVQVKLEKAGKVVYPQTLTDAVAYTPSKTAEDRGEVKKKLTTKLEEMDVVVAELERDKIQSSAKFVITTSPSDSIVEYKGADIPVSITIQMGTNKGNVNDIVEFTDVSLKYNLNSGETKTDTTGKASDSYTFTAPGDLTINALASTAKYKGQVIDFATQRKTISAVKQAYAGYVDDYTNLTDTRISALTKLRLSKRISYSESSPLSLTAGAGSNGSGQYLVVAIPNNGNVSAVTSITQLGTLKAKQNFTSVVADSYTVYAVTSRHNAGSYNFEIK